MNYWEKRAIKNLELSEKNSKQDIQRILKIYNKASIDIKQEINNIYKNYSNESGIDPKIFKELLTKKETSNFWKELENKGLQKYIKSNYKARITRLEKLQGNIYSKVKDLGIEETDRNYNLYKKILKNTYQRVYEELGNDIEFNSFDELGVNEIIKERFLGSNYSKRIWNNTELLADKLNTIIGSGIVTGKSIDRLTNEIEEAFKVHRYYASRLARTEVNHFHNEATYNAYKDMGVEKYVFLATLDGRTSKMCQELDHKVFNLKDKKVGVNFPPIHPNCRSTIRAYLGEDLEPEKTNSSIIKPEVLKVNTIKEKETYTNIEDVFSSVKLTGIEKDYQEEIKQEFLKIANKYPIDTSRTVLKTNSAKRQMGHAANGIIAKFNKKDYKYHIDYKDEICLNRNDYINKDRATLVHKRTNEYFNKRYDGDLSTLWHEYAHQIDYKFAIKKHPELNNIINTLPREIMYNSGDLKSNFDDYRKFNRIFRDYEGSTLSELIYNRLYDELYQNNNRYTRNNFSDDIYNNFGKYALTNKKEFLAEAFTTVNLVPDNKKTEFMIHFEKIFNEEFDNMFRG